MTDIIINTKKETLRKINFSFSYLYVFIDVTDLYTQFIYKQQNLHLQARNLLNTILDDAKQIYLFFCTDRSTS
jgi:hypothetical protein